MSFGVVSGSSFQLKSFIDFGGGFKIYESNLIEITNPSKIDGSVYVFDDRQTVVIYVNGLLSTNVFDVVKKGRFITFKYQDDATLFKQKLVLKLEIQNV